VVEVNNALNGEGPITPERAGTVPAGDLIEMVLSERYASVEWRKKLTGRGGLVAHLGTNDLREVESRMEGGDERARLLFQAMAYSVAKQIGACAAVLAGEVDAVVLSGGLAHSEAFVSEIRAYIRFLGRVLVYPGEDEMAALALGALRVLRGEEDARVYA
jgi:butyrate kinase